MKQFLNKVLSKLQDKLQLKFDLQKDASSNVSIAKNNTSFNGKISVGKNSQLEIQDGVSFSGQLNIGENCKVVVGKDSFLTNVTISVKEGSELFIGEQCSFEAPANFPNEVNVLGNSKMRLSNNVRFAANALVRFGGSFEMGAYSSINYLSEIRCEEKITIGEYCLMSYEVCIYDSNTHSTDWQKRRERIPHGALEIEKPDTKPVLIGNDVWLSKGVSILKGVTLGDKVIVGLRTTVPSGVYPESSKLVSSKPTVLIK
jgi:acetyltransferase-like isoleucine patch superfamily enzyme